MTEEEKQVPIKSKETKKFIQENAHFIYEYINEKILKNTALMNLEYFIKILKEIFKKNTELNINQNILPYFLFTLLGNNGKLDYTSLRADSVNLSQINKESSTYYNYVSFSLNKDFFIIKLMQNKTGGMAIKEDIVKFKKEIPINKSGLDRFILKENKNIHASNKKYLKLITELELI